MSRRNERDLALLRFLGAAGTVTGSRYQLEVAGRTLLVDCGLYQGLKPLRLKNWEPWPFDLRALDAVVLTHAHIDHSGYLPRLFKLGYRGPIYCTDGTAALLGLLLPDSARLQMEEADYANRKGYSKHHPAEPLYTEADAEGALSLLRSVEYTAEAELLPGISAAMHPAGHLLGSASVLLQWGAGAAKRRILFSGDLGKYDDPFMRDPQPPSEAVDYLLIESTYGNRKHDDADLDGKLADLVQRSVSRGGVLLIPAFAVGRTQELLFYFSRLERAGKIPMLDVYVDSPMAVDASHIYVRHHEDLNFDWPGEMLALRTERTRFVRSVVESKALADVKGNAIIISASGMATGGRVLHHLTQRAGESRNTILFAGFQVEGTRGRKLIDGAETFRAFGEEWPVHANVENLRAFSAHGDADDLVRWARSLSRPPRRTFVVHGEPRGSETLRDVLESELRHDAMVPELGACMPLR